MTTATKCFLCRVRINSLWTEQRSSRRPEVEQKKTLDEARSYACIKQHRKTRKVREQKVPDAVRAARHDPHRIERGRTAHGGLFRRAQYSRRRWLSHLPEVSRVSFRLTSWRHSAPSGSVCLGAAADIGIALPSVPVHCLPRYVWIATDRK
jgi:hypothetical protein